LCHLQIPIHLIYLCCGVWTIQQSPIRYCACCCLCFTVDEIVRTAGIKVSKKLKQSGILNELVFVSDTKFKIIVRKMASTKQIIAKGILEKKISEALTEQGVMFLLQVTREVVASHKTTDELTDQDYIVEYAESDHS